MLHDRLGTVMSRAHGNTVLVEDRADIMRMNRTERKRYHAGFMGRRADDAQGVDGFQLSCRVLEEFV